MQNVKKCYKQIVKGNYFYQLTLRQGDGTKMKIVFEFETSAESRKKAFEDFKKKCTIEELKKKIPPPEVVKEKVESGARGLVISAVDIADKAISKVEDLVDEKLAGEKADAEEENYDYGGDIRAAISEVKSINHMSNSNLSIGDVIYVPIK